MDSGLRIAIVDENPVRAAILEEGLREAGHLNVARIAERANLLVRLTTIDPDVILIDLESPSRDVLEQMFQVSRVVKWPIGPIICACFGVGLAAIKSEIESCKSADVDAIGKALRAGTNCGSCLPELKKILANSPCANDQGRSMPLRLSTSNTG